MSDGRCNYDLNRNGDCGFDRDAKPNEYPAAYRDINNCSGLISEPYSHRNSRFIADCNFNGAQHADTYANKHGSVVN
jgi:hypothetical protein